MKDDRGFKVYADETGVRVKQSSRAVFPYGVWIFAKGGSGDAVELSPAQAKVALRGLQAYVKALPPEDEWDDGDDSDDGGEVGAGVLMQIEKAP